MLSVHPDRFLVCGIGILSANRTDWSRGEPMTQGFTGGKFICGIGILPMIPRFTGWKPVPHSRESGDQQRLRRIDDVRKRDRPRFGVDVAKLGRDRYGLRDGCQQIARFLHGERFAESHRTSKSEMEVRLPA